MYTGRIIFAIAGMVISNLLYNLIDNGYFERWENIPASNIQDDFNYYTSVTSEDSFENPPCDYSSPAFSVISNSPRDIDTCAQNIIWYAEADHRAIYVIDSKGNYWKWSHFSYLNFFNMIWFLLGGLECGVFIGYSIDKKIANHPKEAKTK